MEKKFKEIIEWGYENPITYLLLCFNIGFIMGPILKILLWD